MSNADLCCGCGQASISTGGIGCRCGYEPCKGCGTEYSWGTLTKPEDRVCTHCQILNKKWPHLYPIKKGMKK